MKNKRPNWPDKFQKILRSEWKGNLCTRYGLQVERRTLKIYAAQNVGEVITETGLLINKTMCFFGFSADGFHVLNANTIYLLEVKSPYDLKQRKPKKNTQKPKSVKPPKKKLVDDTVIDHLITNDSIDEKELLKVVKYLKFENGKLVLKPAHKFYGQMQLSMCVSGIRMGKLIITRGKKFITVVDVPYDEEFASNFVFQLRNLYFEQFLPFIVDHQSPLI